MYSLLLCYGTETETEGTTAHMLETRPRWRKQSKPLTLFKSKGSGPGRARGIQTRETALNWLLASISVPAGCT
jgi:hypothetical protein